MERLDCELLKDNGRAEYISRLSRMAGNHHYLQLCEANCLTILMQVLTGRFWGCNIINQVSMRFIFLDR